MPTPPAAPQRPPLASCGNYATATRRGRTFSATRRTALVAAAVGLTALTGCTGSVTLDPAPDAANPECAEVIVRLPDTIDNDKQYRTTDAQGTGAWGDPAAVLLRCGVPVPGPTTLPCVTVRDVDWIRDDTDAPIFVFTTYGRDPAVEVIVDSEAASGTNALTNLANSVGVLPKYTECVDAEDVFEFPDQEDEEEPAGE